MFAWFHVTVVPILLAATVAFFRFSAILQALLVAGINLFVLFLLAMDRVYRDTFQSKVRLLCFIDQAAWQLSMLLSD